VLFVKEVFGATPDPWQERVLRAYGRCEPGISVRSCHGPGKTACLAWIIWHQSCCRYPQKTVATAPTSAQLFDALFAEVRFWGNKLPPAVLALFEVKSDSISLKADPAGSFATFRTARPETPEAMQGVHSAWVLLIGDEASGISERIFEAAVGSMSGERATTILAGNPVRTSGLFFDTHHALRDQWFTVHVSAFDSPRVSKRFIERVRRQYGEDSNAYRIRVLGEFPRADLDTIIPYELIAGASGREIVPNPEAAVVWGLDVARFGDCLTALCKRKGSVVPQPIQTWSDLDIMQTSGVIKAEWDMTPPEHRPTDICVDAIGIGAGVADRLKELGLPIRAVNVSETPALAQSNCVNLRTELWWKARQWFTDRTCSIPPELKDEGMDERSTLQSELATVKYKIVDSSGKLRAESKQEMKKRGHKSPDKADAFVLTFAATAASALSGSQRKSWNEPLKLNRKGIV
jgi:phage terminase large subunit